jgi:hypothetical protein
MNQNATDDDETVFEWALAYFRCHLVVFSGSPADELAIDYDDATPVAHRARLNRLN